MYSLPIPPPRTYVMSRPCLAVIALCMVRAALGVAYVAITPRGDGLHLLAVMPFHGDKATVAVTAVNASGAVLLKATSAVTQMADMGVLNAPRRVGIVAVTVQTSSPGVVPLTQRFNINASVAHPLAGLIWVPDGGGTYTLTPIPDEWETPDARWSVVCDGAKPVRMAAWTNRTVQASATSKCSAQVSMDADGYVISDVLQVQGGAFVSTPVVAAHSSASADAAVLIHIVAALSLLFIIEQ